jgi:hypothetical protein
MSFLSLYRLIPGIVAGAVLTGIAILAVELPPWSTCFQLAWSGGFLLLATATVSLGVESTGWRYVVGAMTAFLAACVPAALLTYDLNRDHLAWRESGSETIHLSTAWFLLLFSFAPVFHVSNIQRKIKATRERSRLGRLSVGLALGAKQAGLIACVMVPLLWWLLPSISGTRLPLEIQRGPTEEGRLGCAITLSVAVFVAGIVAGAFAALALRHGETVISEMPEDRHHGPEGVDHDD